MSRSSGGNMKVAVALLMATTLSSVSSWMTTPGGLQQQSRHQCRSLRPGIFIDRQHRCLYTATTSSSIAGQIQEDDPWRSEPVEEADFVICGGGPAGLLSAIMLAKKFPTVSLFFYCSSVF